MRAGSLAMQALEAAKLSIANGQVISTDGIWRYGSRPEPCR